MVYAIIEYKSPTIDNIQMPLHFYSIPLKVIEETEDTVCVCYEHTYYWFKKEYISVYSH